MFVPTISTRTTNVELNEDRRVLITQKLLPLGRYVTEPGLMHIDLVMRQLKYRSTGSQYYLSVKVTTSDKSYMTVAIARRFGVAVTQASDVLKRQLIEQSRKNSGILLSPQPQAV